ncbi:MAG TPA: DUF2520 domain-containing protein [Thermoleophilia bacterium]|nr:DUF2520 domain-containing protein [Thermoleophilia bacterium]
MKLDAYHFAVIGPGRLGSTLIAALDRAGLTVSAIGTHHEDDARLGAYAGGAGPLHVRVADAALEADAWWLTVPDDDIFSVAGQLAAACPGRRRPSCPPLAIHSSGAGSLRLLRPLQEAGVLTLCLHPLQTFSGDAQADALAGVACAVTADDERVAAFGDELAARLGMRPFRLADERKPLYHLSAAVAANLLVALESEAVRLMNEATGRDDGLELLAPLVSRATANVVAEGPAAALTGPVARGDAATVRAHLRLLSRQPARVGDAYRALSLEALTLAAPRLDDDTVRTLKTLLEEGEGR